MERMVKHRILGIYKKDILNIATNWVALTIMIGLSLLPSLYAWVNIGASWDPYSNTKGIKVGIVNEDKGGTFRGSSIDIGEGVVESLKNNDKLGWVFYDNTDEGLEAVNKGKVYATIIIPEDFSLKMSTVLDENPVKPKLEYYVNQKMNAIAPKMTDSGASTLQKQISSSFEDTSVKKAFEMLNKLGNEIDDNYPKLEEYKYKLFELDEKFPDINKKLDKLIANTQEGYVNLDKKNQDISDIQKTLQLTMDYMDDISKDLLDTNDMVNQNTPQVKENLALLQTILTNVSNITKESADSISRNKPVVINDIDTALRDIQTMKSDLTRIANRVGDAGMTFSTDILRMNSEISATLSEYEILLNNLKYDILKTTIDIQPILSNLVIINNRLSTQMGTLNTELNNIYTELDKMLNGMQEVSKSVGEILANITVPNSDAVSSQIDNTIALIRKNNEVISNIPVFNNILLINEQMITILEQMKNNTSNLDRFQQLAKDLQTKNNEFNQSIGNIRTSLSIMKTDISGNLLLLQDTFNKTSIACNDISMIMGISSANIAKEIDVTIVRMAKLNNSLSDTTNKLSKSAVEDSAAIKSRLLALCTKLDELSKRLTLLRDKLQKHEEVETLLYDISELTFNLQSGTQQLLVRLDDSLLPKIEKYLVNSSSYILEMKNIVGNTNKDLDVLRDFLTRIKDGGKATVEELNEVKASLPKTQNNIHSLATKVKEFDETMDLKDISNLMKRDSAKEGDFFSSPVELNTHKVFNVNNYGAAMTPFYSTLSLWVGALLLTALLSTKARNVDFEYSPKEEFFGKYLLFVTFGVFQGFIVALGDIVVLGVKVQEPVLFVLLGIFFSIVFVMIVYALVALFGNVGKAIAVVFMVVQLAGSGGTFPIEILPKFFQMLYALLPFTYAINAMREAVAGVVYDNLVKDISILIIYFITFMIFGLKSKKWVNMVSDKLAHKLGESGVVGH